MKTHRRADYVRHMYEALRLAQSHVAGMDEAAFLADAKTQQAVVFNLIVLGEAAFVHDVAVPGRLHGRVVRPPYAGADHGEFIGRTLRSVDEGSIGHIPGVVAIVRAGDVVVPRGDTVFHLGDEVLALVSDESEAEVSALLIRH